MHNAKVGLPDSSIIKFGKLESHLRSSNDRLADFETEAFLKLFEERVQKASPKLVSVDVFDTLLLRTDESELKRFKLIAEKQAQYLSERDGREFGWQDLIYTRLAGTKMSYKASIIKQGCREGSISEIYKAAVSMLGVEPSLWEEFLKIELDHETVVTKPNRGLYKALKALCERGVKLCLVSDMYLHHEHIGHLLDHHFSDWRDSFEKLYSSADTKISKASGHLFNVVAQDLNVPFNAMVHVGDSYRGDVAQPSRKGIMAIYMPIAEASLENRKRCEANVLEELESLNLNIRDYSS